VSDTQQETGLAGRYASAIFELAQEEKAVEILERDFTALKTLLAGSPDLYRLVHAPAFSRDDQAKGMKAVLERLSVNPLTMRTVLTLASKRRLFALADIIRAFENRVARQRGEVHAKVTSARALTDSQTAELKAVLKAKLGREPKIETRIDPALLGGLVVQVGSRMVDSSLSTKLNGIRLAMRGN
jgi:F-type H+-transporting ATPase subunit delta